MHDEIGGRSHPVRAVILEVGAGCNVPTVRTTSERQLLAWHKAGAEVCLVRVNPELPLGDCPPLHPEGDLGSSVISIMARGLASLHEINATIPQDMGGGGAASAEAAAGTQISQARDVAASVDGEQNPPVEALNEAVLQGNPPTPRQISSPTSGPYLLMRPSYREALLHQCGFPPQHQELLEAERQR